MRWRQQPDWGPASGGHCWRAQQRSVPAEPRRRQAAKSTAYGCAQSFQLDACCVLCLLSILQTRSIDGIEYHGSTVWAREAALRLALSQIYDCQSQRRQLTGSHCVL